MKTGISILIFLTINKSHEKWLFNFPTLPVALILKPIHSYKRCKSVQRYSVYKINSYTLILY